MPDRCTCGRFVPVEHDDFASIDCCSRDLLQIDRHICDLMTDARVKVLQEVAKEIDPGHSFNRGIILPNVIAAADAIREKAAKIRRKARKHV